MKGLRLYIAAAGFLATAAAHAATYDYLVTGSLTSYTASIPSVGTVTGLFDPASPSIFNGSMVVTNLRMTSTSFSIEYFNNSLGGAAVRTTPQSTVNLYGSAYGFTPIVSYNAATRHLSQTAAGNYSTKDTFCVGIAAICGRLYPEGNAYSSGSSPYDQITGTLDLSFSALFDGFTGTFTEIDTLSTGAVVTKVYSLNGSLPPPSSVPLPFTGMLFGSSLLALGGVARRRA